MIYFVVLGICVLFSLIYDDKQSAYRKQYWLLCSVLVLFMGLRYNVGGDSLAYANSFDDFPLLDQITEFDLFGTRYPPLWVILVSFCKTVFYSFVSLQLIQAAFVNIVFFSFFEKNVARKFTAVAFYVFLYYLNFNTETMRAACSIAFFAIGFTYYTRNKWGLFYFFSILSIGFHYEAIILLLLPFAKLFNTLSLNIKNLAVISLIALLLTLSGDIVPAFSEFFKANAILFESIDYYSSNVGKNNFNGYVAFYLLHIPYLSFVYFNKNRLSKDILSMAILFIILSLLSLSFGIIMSRTRDLFAPSILVLIANTTAVIKKNKSIIVKFFTISVIIVVLVVKTNYYIKDDRWKLWYPYSSIFAPENSLEREDIYDYFLRGSR